MPRLKDDERRLLWLLANGDADESRLPKAREESILRKFHRLRWLAEGELTEKGLAVALKLPAQEQDTVTYHDDRQIWERR